ncbi:MAG: hypothetical protein CMJ85_06110 [Planctomycetes bacterium]|nr:hypothetical protein [Planctomycetota bacterium]
MNWLSGLRSHPLPFALGLLGCVASIVLWLCSTGTNDIRSWEAFATEISRAGLFDLYGTNKLFNHPPLMGWLAWLSHGLASGLGLPFAIVFKLFPMVAHLATAVVLWSWWKDRGDPRRAAWAFALYSLAASSILVAAFHGNTDTICAFLCLLCLYFLEVRKKPLAAGLILAAAINVKIIPVLLVCPAIAGFRNGRDVRAFLFGLAAAAVPFLIGIVGGGSAFLTNVFAYGSSPEPWGVQVLLLPIPALPGLTMDDYRWLAASYYAHGKYLLIAAVLVLSVYGYRRRLDHAHLMAATFALFLLLAPGFGVQYVAYLPPLMFAVSLVQGTKFALVSGAFLGLLYAHWSIGAWPLESIYTSIRIEIAIVGFWAWLLLPRFLVTCLSPRTGAGEA